MPISLHNFKFVRFIFSSHSPFSQRNCSLACGVPVLAVCITHYVFGIQSSKNLERAGEKRSTIMLKTKWNYPTYMCIPWLRIRCCFGLTDTWIWKRASHINLLISRRASIVANGNDICVQPHLVLLSRDSFPLNRAGRWSLMCGPLCVRILCITHLIVNCAF